MTTISGKQKRQPNPQRVGFQVAETMAVVSQMALLCPSGLDAWAQRELAGYPNRGRRSRSWAR